MPWNTDEPNLLGCVQNPAWGLTLLNRQNCWVVPWPIEQARPSPPACPSWRRCLPTVGLALSRTSMALVLLSYEKHFFKKSIRLCQYSSICCWAGCWRLPCWARPSAVPHPFVPPPRLGPVPEPLPSKKSRHPRRWRWPPARPPSPATCTRAGSIA